MPASGRLDRVAEIQRSTTIQDEFGQPIETWSAWRVVKMGKRDVRADERFRSDQELATETTVFVSHWISGLQTTDRLVVDEKTYDILGVAELGRRSGLEITATATRV
jgi:SPP1 family predicted phage head-tail adaptor